MMCINNGALQKPRRAVMPVERVLKASGLTEEALFDIFERARLKWGGGGAE